MKIETCGTADGSTIYIGEVCTNVGSERAAVLFDLVAGATVFRDLEDGSVVDAANIVACAASSSLTSVGVACHNSGAGGRAYGIFDPTTAAVVWRDIATNAVIPAANITTCASTPPVAFGIFCTSTGSKAFGLWDATAAAVTFRDWKTGAVVAAAGILAECTETPGAARIANATWTGVAGMRSFTATAQTGTFDVSFDNGATWTTGFVGSRTWGTTGRVFASPTTIKVRSPAAASDIDVIWEV